MAAPRSAPSHENPELHTFMAADAAGQLGFLRSWGLGDATALILLNACENRCFFCANAGTTAVPREAFTRWVDIERHLRGRPPGVTRLLIGGNEPALHPDFDRALTLAQEVGYRHVELMTSGLQLALPDRLARFVEAGLKAVAVPIYASSAPIHDAVCGTPCFDRLAAGLDAARAAGVTVWLHTLALRRNLHDLPALAALAADRWQAKLAIAPLREKQGLFVFDEETVALPELEAALVTMPDSVTLLGMPTCVGRGRSRDRALVMELYFRTQAREHHAVCEGCVDRPTCPGVVAAHMARWGGLGLQPRSA